MPRTVTSNPYDEIINDIRPGTLSLQIVAQEVHQAQSRKRSAAMRQPRIGKPSE